MADMVPRMMAVSGEAKEMVVRFGMKEGEAEKPE